MPIYQNIDGAWRSIAPPAPKVYDAAAGAWVEAEAVFAHAQGRWRQIWPNTVVEGVMIMVNAVGAVWPGTGYVEVSIVQLAQPKGEPIDETSPTVAPQQGTVIVTSGEWRQEFPAHWGQQSWPLPPRSAGTYTVDAYWSQDPDVTGTNDYTIIQGGVQDGVEVTLGGNLPAVVRLGRGYALETDVTYGGSPAPEGGYTMIRHQDVPNGPMGEWVDARIYTGGTVSRIVVPDAAVQWQVLFAGHPNLSEAVSNTFTVEVLNRNVGYDDVVATEVRSYSHSGLLLRQYSYDVFHGILRDSEGNSAHGQQFGVMWLPPLAEDKTCIKVEVEWLPETTGVDTSRPGYADSARMAIGYHLLPEPPYARIYPDDDPRILDSRAGMYMTRGEPFWINCSAYLVDVVNQKRQGGFGLIVGSTLFDTPVWYGSGRPLTIRYHWEQWS